MVRVIRRRSRSNLKEANQENIPPSQPSSRNRRAFETACQPSTIAEQVSSPSKSFQDLNINLKDPSLSCSSLPNNEDPSLPSDPVDTLQYADAASKPSFLSSIRGRKAMLRTWVMANPLVTSSFEDMDKGIAKQTRANTLLNRQLTTTTTDSSKKYSAYSDPMDPIDSSSRIPSLCCSSSSCSSPSSDSSSSSRQLCFSNKVKAYYSNSHVVEESIKAPNKRPPLEVRLARSRMTYPADPAQPLSAAGKWLNQRS